MKETMKKKKTFSNRWPWQNIFHSAVINFKQSCPLASRISLSNNEAKIFKTDILQCEFFTNNEKRFWGDKMLKTKKICI